MVKALQTEPAQQKKVLKGARAEKPGLFTWRRELFRWMQRNSPATAEYVKLLPDRVIELGTRVTL